MSENLNKDAKYNLNRLPNVEVPSGRPLNSHEPPIAVTRNWIAGDFTGLRTIADELYAFAALSHDEISGLARYVERLIGDTGNWKSDTANAFRWSFGGDATLINDLAQVAVAIGRVIENLANNLASLEASVDSVFSPRITSGIFRLESPPDNENFMVVAVKLDGRPVIAPRRSSLGSLPYTAKACFEAAIRKAKRLRKEAAIQITALCEPVNKNLDLYTSPSGEQREREGLGQGPLRADQAATAHAAITALQQQFKSAITDDGGITAGDVTQALDDIGKFGGNVNTIGGVVDDIRAMQHADALAQAGKAGRITQQVSSVVRDLIIFLAVVPK